MIDSTRYIWTRTEHRGVTWYLHPEGKCPRMYQVAIVSRHYGTHPKDPRFRANVIFAGHTYWVLVGSMLRGRRLLEQWLDRRCCDWDGKIANSAWESANDRLGPSPLPTP